jgi:starch synthase (maltosyl-transferring)
VARSIFFYTDSRVLGGAENAMFMLLESLDREAWDPTLLLDDAPGVEPLEERAAALGVPVERVAPLPLGLAGARRLPGLARFLARRRPQVFHAHMSSPVACKYALAAAVLARVPAVLGTVQVGEYDPPDRLAYWQLWALARGVGAYLAVSRAIAAELVGPLGWPAGKVQVSYNAVEPSRFAVEAPAGRRAELGGDDGAPLVLVPARLDAQKGHGTLLRAAVDVPAAVFVLAGEGPERAALEALAADLGVGDRVRFLGRRDDIPELLAACDVFALPSLYEGSSLAVLEAMAARRPIVSSAIPGTDELIEDGRTGLLVPPGDAGGLAAALRRLLGDPELAARLANAARERVELDLTRTAMTTRVEGVYRRLLGGGPAGALAPEPERNRALRREDWRFACDDARLLASWRVPRPGAARRARRRAEAAGFTDVHVYWAGPLPHRPPNFWLPLDSPEAVRHLLAASRQRSLGGRALQVLWRLARAAGLLAPIYVVGRPPGAAADAGLGQATEPLLLLTAGHRSINKVVGLSFRPGAEQPDLAIKFARTAEAESGLGREAEALGRLGAEHPGLRAAPGLRGRGERAGRLAVVEEAVVGDPLLDRLDEASFAAHADRVVDLLLQVARRGKRPDPTWRERLVEAPLRDLERNFGPALGAEELAALRSRLAGLPDLSAAFEHRDCSPWNILLGPAGTPILLDWESAEPDGLAGLDLIYFIANSIFVLDGALDRGTTRESYARMLDEQLPSGRVAAAAMTRYADALAIDPDDLARLRLLCWVIHSRSDHQHLTLAAAGPPTTASLHEAPFLGLIREELSRVPQG